MKDYREHSRAYKPEEWETDKEWVAHRLEFIWTFGDYYPAEYSNIHLGNEKEELYRTYGSDNEISKMSYDFHNSQYKDIYKFNADNKIELFNEFDRLNLIKEHNADFFLRKRIYIKYYYLSEFIRDYLDEEYQEYINNYR